jgi:hypothetical protein
MNGSSPDHGVLAVVVSVVALITGMSMYTRYVAKARMGQ